MLIDNSRKKAICPFVRRSSFVLSLLVRSVHEGQAHQHLLQPARKGLVGVLLAPAARPEQPEGEESPEQKNRGLGMYFPVRISGRFEVLHFLFTPVVVHIVAKF